MAEPILIVGQSGSGKTTSMRNLDPADTYLISVISKPLTFPGWSTKFYETNGKPGNRKVIIGGKNLSFEDLKGKPQKALEISETICKTLKAVTEKTNKKIIVIDDTQYIMAYEFMARAKETGFGKYNDIALNFFQIVTTIQSLPDDVSVYMLHHSELTEGGKKAKTLGKMIDNTITLEGLFTVVLFSDSRKVNGKMQYFFTTNSDGTTTAKSPIGLFDSQEIENDLASVNAKLKAYKSINLN